MSLPIVETCDGCGACCREQGSPPGYLQMVFPSIRAVAQSAYLEREDYARFTTLPSDALASLQEYARALQAGEIPGGGACIWFDSETRGCKHYEHRPDICRGFDVGSPACIRWRERHGIGN
jgi:uncharacterized protein